MDRWLIAVQTNCTDPSREKEFNDWYDNTHVPEVLEVQGIVRMTRYENVKATIRSPIFSSDWSKHPSRRSGKSPFDESSGDQANRALLLSSFNMKDGDEHMRIRSLVNLAFSRAALEVSQRSGVWVGHGFNESGRLELYTGDASLEVEPSEVAQLLSEVVRRAADHAR